MKNSRTEGTHGQGSGAHGRAWKAESCREEEKWRERKGKFDCVLDRLSFVLDTVITTKARLRALKIT